MNETIFDQAEIFARGVADPEVLTPDERVVYLARDIEVWIDMEGWDSFFMGHEAHYFGELKAGLSAAGDTDSLAILEDYEQHLAMQGVLIQPDALSDFLAAQSDAYFRSRRDWSDDFDALIELRWRKIGDYLRGKGIELTGAG